MKKKNPAAVALGKKRWKGVPKAERKKLLTEWGKKGGRPKKK